MPPERKAPPARETAPAPKPAVPSGPTETGWLPDFVYTGEKFESGVAFFADALGRISRFSRETADLAKARRLAGQAALPGLVNAHSHAWQRLARGRTDGAARAAADKLTPADVFETARAAFVEMLVSGITCVGEFHDLPSAAPEVLRAAKDVGVRIAFFPVAPAGATADAFLRETEILRALVAQNHAADEAWLGVAVSEPGAVSADFLKALGTYAHAQRFRFHTHLPARGSLAALTAHGLVDKRFTAIGGAALADDEIKALGAARAALCVCPGTGVAAPVEKLLAAGAGIALGTDSHPRIHLLADARETAGALGGAAAALHAATVAGARSLGATGGALEVGRPADFFTVNLLDPSLAGADATSLLPALLAAGDRRAVHEVWIGARQVVSGGRHPHQGAIVGRFNEVQKRLWSA